MIAAAGPERRDRLPAGFGVATLVSVRRATVVDLTALPAVVPANSKSMGNESGAALAARDDRVRRCAGDEGRRSRPPVATVDRFYSIANVLAATGTAAAATAGDQQRLGSSTSLLVRSLAVASVAVPPSPPASAAKVP